MQLMKSLIFYLVMELREETDNCSCKKFESYHAFQHERRKIVVLSDQKSRTTYKYTNNRLDYLAQYNIDGGLLTSNDESKCDYLLINCNKKEAFFIEIKGCDIGHAAKQILSSIDKLYSILSDLTIHARIVVTRVNTHSLQSSSYHKLQKRIKALNGSLNKKTSILEDVNN